MTYNHTYQDYKVNETERDCVKCKPKKSKTKEILLECGDGTGSRTFTSSNDTAFQIARVTIDSTSLKRPNVLVKFSSTVRFEGVFTGTIRIKYELFRVCGKEEQVPLDIQMYEKINGDITSFGNTEDSFNFIFCDRIICPNCCEYFVTVTPIEITNAKATVSNGRMAVLAQSTQC